MSKRGRVSAVMLQRAFLYRPPSCAISQESDSASERRDSRCAMLAPDSGAANDEGREPRGLIGRRTAGPKRGRGAPVRATRHRSFWPNYDVDHHVADE